jgi:membrane-associated phospholipid phosphatase
MQKPEKYKSIAYYLGGIFFICLFLYFLVELWAVYRFKKGTLELFVNSLHTPFLDFFFKNWTWLGDGWFFALINVVLLFISLRYGLAALVAILLQTFVVQYLKLDLYHEEPRPITFFKTFSFIDVSKLNFVEGVDVLQWNSFPSGHTATAFCWATFLALVVLKEKTGLQYVIQLGLFAAACFVALSRIYLLQHFLLDTLVGALIGSSLALSVFSLFEFFPSKFLDNSIITIFNKD